MRSSEAAATAVKLPYGRGTATVASTFPVAVARIVAVVASGRISGAYPSGEVSET